MKMQLATLVKVTKEGEDYPLQMLINAGEDVEGILEGIELEDGEIMTTMEIAYCEVVDE